MVTQRPNWVASNLAAAARVATLSKSHRRVGLSRWAEVSRRTNSESLFYHPSQLIRNGHLMPINAIESHKKYGFLWKFLAVTLQTARKNAIFSHGTECIIDWYPLEVGNFSTWLDRRRTNVFFHGWFCSVLRGRADVFENWGSFHESNCCHSQKILWLWERKVDGIWWHDFDWFSLILGSPILNQDEGEMA